MSSPINPPTGCVFHTRCPYAMGVCSQQCPAMHEVMPGHRVACHLHVQPHEDQLDLRKEALILMGYMDLPRVSLINLPTPLEECRRLRATLLALLIALGIQLACLGLGKLLYRFAPEPRRKVLQYATLCSNAGFMGNPIVEGIYGAQGLLYASVYLIPLRFFMWSALRTPPRGRRSKSSRCTPASSPCESALR